MDNWVICTAAMVVCLVVVTFSLMNTQDQVV